MWGHPGGQEISRTFKIMKKLFRFVKTDKNLKIQDLAKSVWKVMLRAFRALKILKFSMLTHVLGGGDTVAAL